MGFPSSSDGKESACDVADLGSIPGFGRAPGEGKSYLLQYSGLENSMDCIIHSLFKIFSTVSGAGEQLSKFLHLKAPVLHVSGTLGGPDYSRCYTASLSLAVKWLYA